MRLKKVKVVAGLLFLCGTSFIFAQSGRMIDSDSVFVHCDGDGKPTIHIHLYDENKRHIADVDMVIHNPLNAGTSIKKVSVSTGEVSPVKEQVPAMQQSSVLSCGYGLFYNVDEKGVCTITGTGDEVTDSAFFNDATIREVVLPPSVKTIKRFAFANCKNLKNINLSEITTLWKGAFAGCSSLQNVVLPNVVSIGNGAFFECFNLKSVEAPSAVIVGAGAFWDCSYLKVAILPNVEEIKDIAFGYCLSLKAIDLPRLDVAGANAFSTSGVAELRLGEKIPSSVDSTAFANNAYKEGKMKIYIPVKSAGMYYQKSLAWGDYWKYFKVE